ncbi:MAG: hypothetical protein WAN74_07780 [Thermoplasmata archaeon]
MSALISRGLIATEDRLSKMIVTSRPAPQAVADRVIALLQREPVGGFHWRERAEWSRRLARGDPDERGRRLLTDAGRMDARYVARVSTIAQRRTHTSEGEPRGLSLPSPAQWSLLRAAIGRIYEELGGRLA